MECFILIFSHEKMKNHCYKKLYYCVLIRLWKEIFPAVSSQFDLKYFHSVSFMNRNWPCSFIVIGPIKLWGEFSKGYSISLLGILTSTVDYYKKMSLVSPRFFLINSFPIKILSNFPPGVHDTILMRHQIWADDTFSLSISFIEINIATHSCLIIFLLFSFIFLCWKMDKSIFLAR